MNEIRYTSLAQEVIFGAGSLARLRALVDHFGWRRFMLCTTGSQRRAGSVEFIEHALGNRLVAIYERVQPHVPQATVDEVTQLATEREVDAVIGLGGGSALGVAKAVGLVLAQRAHPANGGAQPGPICAIPTTYAGSEMTPVFGVTRPVVGTGFSPSEGGYTQKTTVTDPRVTPRLVIYDPLLTLNLPPDVTASTGINALAHCIEALYSITRNPLSSAAALAGIRAIIDHLPSCYASGDDLDARTGMLTGAWLAGTALAHVAMALHHGLCHVLGGTAGVPHGIANGIILPHAIRFNLPATAGQLARAAEAMGISLAGRSARSAVEEAIERITTLIAQLHLPQRLRDAGVREADLPQLARLAMQSRAVQSNPRPISEPAQIEEILRAAW